MWLQHVPIKVSYVSLSILKQWSFSGGDMWLQHVPIKVSNVSSSILKQWSFSGADMWLQHVPIKVSNVSLVFLSNGASVEPTCGSSMSQLRSVMSVLVF